MTLTSTTSTIPPWRDFRPAGSKSSRGCGRLKTGLNEDRPSFEGVPPSLVVGPGKRSSIDSGTDYLSVSPGASPTIPRAVRRLDIPYGAETPRRSSSLTSLHSIVEETGVDDEAEEQPAVFRPSAGTESISALNSSTSDEDEGVVLGGPEEGCDERRSVAFRIPDSGACRIPCAARQPKRASSKHVNPHPRHRDRRP